MPYPVTQNPAPPTFGTLLKALRKAGGMTQRDLAAALGYSDSQISGLEKDQRLPDLDAVMQRFVPALGLQDDPVIIARLVDRAAAARGEHPPALRALQHATPVAVQKALRQDQLTEQAKPLPLPPTPLIGRSTTVNQLCNRLLGHNGRLLTLIGPPGIGKTRLALAVAARLQHHYPQGAVVVPLAAINEPTLMAATIAAAVGCHDTSAKPPKAKVIEFLRRKTMLLVLDNLEQIHEAAPLIAEVVAECPGLCILATSRERLHLRAEQRFKVPVLELAAAVELFTQRAQMVDAEFALTTHHQQTLEAVCQRLDCLPLAIELCAAQIDLLAPSQLLTQLQDHRLDLLVDGAHDLPPRQRTLRNAIGSSYSLLNQSERLLLHTVGVFVGGFALTEVTAVAAARLQPAIVQSTLHALIGKSLVRAETLPSGEQRFLLLETIREFSLEQARTHKEEAMLRQRHYAAYLQLFRTGDGYLRGPEAPTWVTRLEAEQDNLRAALQWTLDASFYADTAWLIIAVNWFWEHCGFYDEARRWYAQLLPHRQALAPDLRLAILVSHNPLVNRLKAAQTIERYWDEIMVLQEVSTFDVLRSAVWFFYATKATDSIQAADAFKKAIAYARAASATPMVGPEYCFFTDCDFILGTALRVYADCLIDLGNVTDAATFAKESFELFQSHGNRFERVGGLGVWGTLALFQGDLVQARQNLLEVVSIVTAVNEQEALSDWLPLLGLITLYSGDALEAYRLLAVCLQLCLKIKSDLIAARACAYLAEISLWQGKLGEAEGWLAQSFAYVARPTRITYNEVQRRWVAARLATAQQHYRRAATLFGLAEQAHSQIGYTIAGPMHDRAEADLATVRTMLEPAVFAEAFAVGQQMLFGEAFTTLLAPVHPYGQELDRPVAR